MIEITFDRLSKKKVVPKLHFFFISHKLLIQIFLLMVTHSCWLLPKTSPLEREDRQQSGAAGAQVEGCPAASGWGKLPLTAPEVMVKGLGHRSPHIHPLPIQL